MCWKDVQRGVAVGRHAIHHFQWVCVGMLLLVGCGQVTRTPDATIQYPSGELGIIINASTNTIVEVIPKSPAQQAGVQVGDVLTQFEGKTYNGTIKDAKTIMGAMLHKRVTIEIERNGKKQTIAMVAGTRLIAPPLYQPSPTPILDPAVYL